MKTTKSNNNQPKFSRRQILSLLIPLVLLAISLPGILDRIVLIKTESIDEKVCFTKPVVEPTRIEKGDVVFLRNPKIAGCRLIAKYATGIPGSIINVMKDKIAIDHKVEIRSFATGEKRISQGISQLKEDEYFVTGTHQKSWDSRYIGPVKRDQIERKGLFCF